MLLRQYGTVYNLLSLAVLAFAVDDMNDLESVMTSARPFAFLQIVKLELDNEERECTHL